MKHLDTDYFGRKLAMIVRDLSCYTPQEMARELVRLAKVADENEAVKEANPTAQSVRDALEQAIAALDEAASKLQTVDKPHDFWMGVGAAVEAGESAIRALIQSPQPGEA